MNTNPIRNNNALRYLSRIFGDHVAIAYIAYLHAVWLAVYSRKSTHDSLGGR